MIKPSIHINGTSAKELAEKYLEAASKTKEALNALYNTAPNGRDYYP